MKNGSSVTLIFVFSVNVIKEFGFSCLLFSCRSALGSLLSSSRQHQDTLAADRERRRLEREERLQRIEREERNRLRLVSLHSFHAADNILYSLSFKAEAAALPKYVGVW